MHHDARAWDIIHNVRDKTLWVPNDRPCDRCGLPVVEGFIHDHCLREEIVEGFIHDHCLREEIEEGYAQPYLRRLADQLPTRTPCGEKCRAKRARRAAVQLRPD